ncbi:MAG: hypothetical protein ACRD20_10440 [Terriglobales bacterium]
MAAERAIPIPIADPASNVITINADGSYTPSTGVSINAGGVAKFDVTYPPNTNTCYITFGTITFAQVDQESGTTGTTGGTVKVGS